MSVEWIGVPEDIKKYQGFVYRITNLNTGRMYIGKKFYWNQIRRKPLKGKRRIRRDVVESDWRQYYGSSNELRKDLEKYGENAFKREIIVSYKSKFECAYYEAKMQFDENVLFSKNYYNEIINVRLRRVGEK